MSRWRPNPSEERWIALSTRYPALQAAIHADVECGAWRPSRPRSRIGFFLLALFAAYQAQGLVALLWVSVAGADDLALLGLVTGLLSIGVAEGLILTRRLFRSGLEEGLWLAGITSICAYVLPRLVPQHLALAFALPAACFVLAGLRLLNPLAVTIGAVLSSGAVATLASERWQATDAAGAGVYCLVLALFALVLGNRRFLRPTYDDVLDQLVIVLPVLGFVWALVASPAPLTWARLAGPWYPDLLPLLIPLVSATAGFLVGLRQRRHAPLVAMLAGKLCLAIVLRDLVGLPLRDYLVLWGALALMAAVLLDRWLRVPRHGFTTTLGDDEPTSAFASDISASKRLAGELPQGFPSPYQGDGGSFGGGGASGRY